MGTPSLVAPVGTVPPETVAVLGLLTIEEGETLTDSTLPTAPTASGGRRPARVHPCHDRHGEPTPDGETGVPFK